MLLHYVGEDHEDIVYEWDAPEGSGNNWPTNKFNKGLDFPNIPYYIDGDLKLTQSSVILRYLGKKYNLIGNGDKENAMIDMLVDTTTDMRMNLAIPAYYEPDFVS